MVCRLRVNANTVVCAQCGRLVHGRCAGYKRVTAQFSRNFFPEIVKVILEAGRKVM